MGFGGVFEKYVSTQDMPHASGTIPHGGIVVRGSGWATQIRGEIEVAHGSARAAKSTEARDDVFAALRQRFATDLRHVGQEGSTLVSLQEKTGSWKMLPLPRSEVDAFVLVFDDVAVADQVLREASDVGVGSATWSTAGSGSVSSVPRPITEFLEDYAALPEAQQLELRIKREVLAKPFAKGLSYVENETRQSFCFTGHYGKVMHKSSGSLLHMRSDKPLDRDNPEASFGDVRFFSPKEILNLLGFPASYQVPVDMALKHRYKCVGNSIAVTVCSELLEVLLLGKDPSRLRFLNQNRG